uniref:Reverse transcriptase domain-containing protein n=1 Tax=Tanacetum cinerariifolium TaxID=118510 RepID=A0A6L2KQY3_TANCI|nr:hypothetical protein [Tanacetum cinerariifolium]
MRTRSSSNLPIVSSNLSTSNPKRHNHRRSKQPFILEESPIDTMADQGTMAELLHAPIEGYVEAIVVLSILAEQFELKHSLINMMTSDQFFGIEKDNPHDHIRWFNKITSTIKYKDVPNSAWDRYKDLLCACPHHGFTELYKLDTFYNALNTADQDSLNVAAGGNLLERRTQDVLTIIENKSKSPLITIKIIPVIVLQMNSASTSRSGSLPSNTIANPKGELKAITTRSGRVLDGPTVPTPTSLFNLEEDKRVEETLMDPDLAEYTIELHINTTLADALILMPKYQKMLKALLSNKEKLQELTNTPLNENCSAVILKKFLEKLKDLEKFLILCGLSELKCKALADLDDFVIVDYKSDPRVPFILGRPFLQTAHALIDVHGEEMILRDGDEKLTLNMRHDTSSYTNQPQKESINLINVFNNSSEDFLEDLSWFHQRSTYSFSSNPLLEEFADELALITFPSEYDDDLQFDVESDLKEIESLLYQDIDSSLKDSIDQSNLINPADSFVDSIPEMFVDEHALDYSSPSIFDEYDDDFLEVESNTENVYDDPFDCKGEKIKETKLLIDKLDLPCDFLLSEYDSFISQDFSRVDALPSTDNEDKIFNPCILI